MCEIWQRVRGAIESLLVRSFEGAYVAQQCRLENDVSNSANNALVT